ncbi:hypothetical protein GCM10027031_07750 [Corynebacterium atrinae]
MTAVVAAVAIGISSVLTPVAQAQVARPDVQQRDGDRTVGCSVDWNAEAIYDPRFSDWTVMGFSENVDEDTGDFKKFLQVQHFGNAASRVAVATSKTINNAKLVVELQEVEGKSWTVGNSAGRLFPAEREEHFDKPITPVGTISGNTATYDLGTLEAGSFTSTSQSIRLDPGQLQALTEPAADGTWSDAFKVNARLTGDLAPEDCESGGTPPISTCVAAGLTVGLPLLLLVPVGMAGQLNIPGLDQLNADLQAQLRNANSQLQQQFGVFDPSQAQYINQINAEIARFTADNRTIINGAAMVALGLLAASYLYNSCVGEDGTSSTSSLSSGSSE